jgi:hypothetical protein
MWCSKRYFSVDLRLVHLAAGLALLCPASALDLRGNELQFSSTTQVVAVSLGDRYAAFNFAFRNTGQSPIRFVSAEVSCGCTSYKIPDGAIQPGEDGGVSVVIDLRGKAHRKRIAESLVLKTDKKDGSYTLEAVVECPTPLVVSSRIVRWKVGEVNEAKRVKVMRKSIGSSDVVPSVMRAVSSSTLFRAEMLPSDEQGVFWLEVAPRDTHSKISAIITFELHNGSSENLPEVFAYVAD